MVYTKKNMQSMMPEELKQIILKLQAQGPIPEAVGEVLDAIEKATPECECEELRVEMGKQSLIITSLTEQNERAVQEIADLLVKLEEKKGKFYDLEQENEHNLQVLGSVIAEKDDLNKKLSDIRQLL